MKRLFNKYFQSVLFPDEFEQFSEYIKNPENTNSISKSMKSKWDQFLADDSFRRENPELLKNIQQQIFAEERMRATRKLKFYAVAMRVAAVLLIGLIITSAWFYQRSQSFLENITTQTVSIPPGATTQLVMPDGSNVWLNSGSRITYLNDFSKQRKVELVGEAFFDVIKKGNIPFEVNTDYGTIQVLGTAFNVQAYPDGSFVTTLERGIVMVTDKENKQQVVINPGEQVQLVRDVFMKNKVDTELFTSWKEGKLIFSREPFPSMIKKLERWYNVKINFSAGDLESLWFSGTIEGETVIEVLEMISKTAPVSYTYNPQERFIKISANKVVN